jgi:hypothetical protein
LGNARPVTLHHVSGAHALGGHNITLVSRRLLRQQGDVGTPARVVLDALNRVRPRRPPLEVKSAEPPLVTTSTMSDGDLAAMVSATLPVAFLGDRQRQIRPALPEVIVDGPFKMPKTGRPRLVRSHLDRLDLGRGGAEAGGAVVTGRILDLALQPGRVASDGAELKGSLAQ